MSIFNEKQIKAMTSGRYIVLTVVTALIQMSMAVKGMKNTKTYTQPEKMSQALPMKTNKFEYQLKREGSQRNLRLFSFCYEEIEMRYHYQKPDIYLSMYGELYICNHPVYDRCTLFTIGNKGLAVIQQRFSADTKSTYWTEVDSWLTDSLYLHPKFKEYFDSRSGECTDGLYPTVTIRQIMWALKMKPIQRQRWETCFDRREI